MKKLIFWLIPTLIAFITISVSAQLEWARVGIQCPCTVESEDGKTATVSLGIQNFETAETDLLYISLAITGYFEDEELNRRQIAILGTTSLNQALRGFAKSPTAEYEIELGQLPEGQVFLELILHEGPRINNSSLLDFVWFEGETKSPFTSISKKEMNFLIDTDQDGVDDTNEGFMGTDPNDAGSVPGTPVVDVAVLYEQSIQPLYGSVDVKLALAHIFNATNFFYQSSGVDIQFRIVGFKDDSEIPEIKQGFFLPSEQRSSVQKEFGADLIVVFHPATGGLGGIAEDIGGWRGRGFIHERNRAILTHVYLSPGFFPINITAHEIGHLIGLGHSYVQGAIGTFYWSRGHGVDFRFGTIMSYANSAYRGIDIDRFSDPLADCNGDPCGVSHELTNHEGSANATLSSQITRFQVASTGTPPAGFDFDGDGIDAISDVFPTDPEEWADSDGDGWGDNTDLFPNDPHEWADFDGDGIGDNTDPDIDNDGIENIYDHDPFDQNIQTVKIRRIVSSSTEDMFGYAITLINDVSGDGHEDIAVAAPHFDIDSMENVGKISLFSINDSDLDELFMKDGKHRTTVDTEEVMSGGNVWTIQGSRENDELGFRLDFLPATDHDSPNHLVASYRNSFVLVQLDDSSLQAFDALDGVSDRNIHIAHCQVSDACWFIGDNPDFKMHGFVQIEERDFDGMSDLAVLGSRYTASDLSLYLLTTTGIKSFNASTGTSNALDTLVATTPFCYRVDMGAFRDQATLSNLGSVTGDIYPAIGVSYEGMSFFEDGTAYVLNTDLVALWDVVDSAPDGVVEISDLFRPGFGSYKFSANGVRMFGAATHTTPDIDGDGRGEIMIWSGGSTTTHYILGSTSLDTVDALDGNIDGTGIISFSTSQVENVWAFTTFSLRNEHAARALHPGTSGQDSFVFNHLAFDQSVLFSLNEILDFDHTDPLLRNGHFSIFDAIESSKTQLVGSVVGLRATSIITGITALNDIDGDNQVDFVFAHHVQEEDFHLYSRLDFMYSNSFTAIDKADGALERFLALHNNLDDTDGDGLINLKDDDDDNDSALDNYDLYPLHANAAYDQDHDDVADSIDAFPQHSFYSEDMDQDGIPDQEDSDRDGDGISNALDDHPNDTDNDGIDNWFDSDDDNDGVADKDDAFPIDPSEQYDSDGDGYADNQDAFANDASEWLDTDGDGIGNNADIDDDNDGYNDSVDRFPLNKFEWADSDGDGIGDNADPFPNDRFEWQDEDGDGVGDNFAGAKIESYRFQSKWNPITFAPDTPTVLPLFGLNGPEDISVLILGASPGSPRDPHFLVSKEDIGHLDNLDEARDQTIQMDQIAAGERSWILRNYYYGAPGYFFTGSTSYGAKPGMKKNVILQTPTLNNLTGAVYILVGNTLTQADASDGFQDGKINYASCPDYGDCIRIDNDIDQWVFGWGTTSLHGVLTDDESALIVTNYYATPSSTSPDESIPLMQIIPMKVIHDLAAEMETGVVALSDVLSTDGVYQIYSHLAGSRDAWASRVKQIPDIDQDGVGELLLTLPLNEYTYVLASTDLRAVLNDPTLVDERLNLGHFHDKPNSYRISATPAFTQGHFGNSPTTDRLVPFTQSSLNETIFALDMSELSIHDDMDGTEDGVIEQFDILNSNAWRIDGISDATICYGAGDDAKPSVVGGFSTWTSTEIRYATLEALETYHDSVANTEQVVHIADAINAGTPGAYAIVPEESDTYEVWRLSYGCAWDWNDDAEPDITISQTVLTPDYAFGQGQVNLIMSSDLPALDLRDGTKNNRSELSILWEKAPDPEDD